MSGAALNAIVAPWFERDRPKAISMAFNGASVGGVVFVPLWTALIAGVGLSLAALVMACATVAVVCPLAWRFLRHEPAVATPKMQAPSSRRSLLRQPGFVTISAAFALGLFAQIGLFAHLIARLEPDFGAALAATAISLITLCAVLGRTLLGWLLGERDRRRRRGGQSPDAGGRHAAAGVWRGHGAAGGGLRAVRPGRGQSRSLPPLIAQSEFRPADVGTVVALVTAINQAVFAFAPVSFGWLHDMTDSYIAVILRWQRSPKLSRQQSSPIGRRFS